jgi:hypothetical protein
MAYFGAVKKIIALIAALAVLTAGEAYANIRNDMVGKWDVVTIRTLGKERVKFTGLKLNVTKLRNGTHKSVGTGTVKGIGRIRSESWSYSNGTSEGLTYVNGELSEISSGTWRVRGNRIIFSETLDGLDGAYSYDGYTLRVNRNKFVTYLKIGRVNQTTTHTRVKR